MKKIIYNKIDVSVKQYAKAIKSKNPELLLSKIMDTLSTYLGYRHYHELKKAVDSQSYNKKDYLNLHEANEYQISTSSMQLLYKIIQNESYQNCNFLDSYLYKNLVREKIFNSNFTNEIVIDLTKNSYYLEINHIEFEHYIFNSIDNLQSSYSEKTNEIEKKLLKTLSKLIFMIIKKKYQPHEYIQKFNEYINFEKLSFLVFPNMPEKELYDEYVDMINSIDHINGDFKEFIKLNKVFCDILSELSAGSIVFKNSENFIVLNKTDLKQNKIIIKTRYQSNTNESINYFQCLLDSI